MKNFCRGSPCGCPPWAGTSPAPTEILLLLLFSIYLYDSRFMFRFTTAGESHGRALVAIVEGLPAGLPIDIEQINHQLWRRQQGYGRGARMKIEQDRVETLSGVRHGQTLGSPIALMIENKDWENWQEVMAAEAADLPPEKSRRVKRPRPGHADRSEEHT